MRLTHLSLHRFRSFPELELDLPGGLVLLHGANGAGKSNLLEACYLLAITKSYRAEAEREMLSVGACAPGEVPYLRVAGAAQRANGTQVRVQMDLLWRDASGSASDGTALSKRIRVNGSPRRASEALGVVSAVLFTAGDIEIILGPPASRRRFLDVLLCQLDPAYLRALQRYQQVLTQRNHLLRLVRDGQARPEELGFWDEQLARSGGTITGRRRTALRELASLADGFYTEVASGTEALQVAYRPSVEHEAEDEADLAAAMLRELEQVRRQEVAAGQTLRGPHRDEVHLLVGGLPVGRYGSRGQARSVALALRLAECHLIASTRGEEPVLLLDDLLSELDASRRHQVLQAAARAQQALITGTNVQDFADPALRGAPRFLVTPGAVTRQE